MLAGTLPAAGRFGQPGGLGLTRRNASVIGSRTETGARIAMVKDSLGNFLIRIRPPKLKSGLAVFFACLAVLIFGAVSARAASFTASLDRDTMTLGESATLSLTFEGGQSKNVPTPSVPGLQIVNTGNSQNFSIINGAMSSTVTVAFSVTARQPGEFTIPALKADVNGQPLSTKPLKLTVTTASAPSAAAVNSG